MNYTVLKAVILYSKYQSRNPMCTARGNPLFLAHAYFATVYSVPSTLFNCVFKSPWKSWQAYPSLTTRQTHGGRQSDRHKRMLRASSLLECRTSLERKTCTGTRKTVGSQLGLVMDIVRKWTDAEKGLSLSRRVLAKRRRPTTDTNKDDTVGQCPGNTVYDQT